MDPEKLQKFKNLLERAATELRASMTQTESTAPVGLDTAVGRLSHMDLLQSQQMATALKERQRQQLTRVERALRALADGTYGICKICRGTIAEERLEVQPETSVCVKCAAKAEQLR